MFLVVILYIYLPSCNILLLLSNKLCMNMALHTTGGDRRTDLGNEERGLPGGPGRPGWPGGSGGPGGQVGIVGQVG